MKKIILLLLICTTVFGLLLLTSCGKENESAEKVKEALEEEGYTVVSIPTGGKAGIERSFTATKYDDETEELEWIQIFYITETADGVYDYIEDLFEEKQEEEKEKDREIIYNKKEGVIWFGTVAAVKAANLFSAVADSDLIAHVKY